MHFIYLAVSQSISTHVSANMIYIIDLYLI